MRAAHKKIAKLYVVPNSRQANVISRHIANVLDDLNRCGVYIENHFVAGRGEQEALRAGVKSTPTLVFNGAFYEGTDTIIRVLTPPSRGVDRPPISTTSAEEFLEAYHRRILSTGDEDTETADDRGMNIRQKIAAFQKRRPEMQGVQDAVPGGRKITQKRVDPINFSSDDDFRRMAGVDNLEPTPAAGFGSAEDGLAILEDYYNSQADESGRQHTRTRRPIPRD